MQERLWWPAGTIAGVESIWPELDSFGCQFIEIGGGLSLLVTDRGLAVVRGTQDAVLPGAFRRSSSTLCPGGLFSLMEVSSLYRVVLFSAAPRSGLAVCRQRARTSLRPPHPSRAPQGPELSSVCCRLLPIPPTNSFICTVFLGSTFMQVSTYLFFSDLLRSVKQVLGPSTTLQTTHFHSFLWLSDIPVYVCTTSSLCIISRRAFQVTF